MTKTILFRSLAPTVAFAAFTLCVLAPSPVTAEDKSQDKSLVGTWSGTFNDPFVGQVLVLTTYNFGGTAVATTGSPADSEQHGVWERTGAREFAATLLGYTRDPSGKVIGKLRIRVRTTLSQDRNAGSGTAEVDIMDLNDVIVFQVKGVTHQETRVEVD